VGGILDLFYLSQTGGGIYISLLFFSDGGAHLYLLISLNMSETGLRNIYIH